MQSEGKSYPFDHLPVIDYDAHPAYGRVMSMPMLGARLKAISYFGYGFHEDALQAGLLVAEQLGGGVRPWSLPDVPSRVPLPPADFAAAARAPYRALA